MDSYYHTKMKQYMIIYPQPNMITCPTPNVITCPQPNVITCPQPNMIICLQPNILSFNPSIEISSGTPQFRISRHFSISKFLDACGKKAQLEVLFCSQSFSPLAHALTQVILLFFTKILEQNLEFNI